MQQDALFKPPTNPETAEEVERPNVAAIAAQEAVRIAASSPSEEKDENSAYNGIDRTMSSSYGPSTASRDGHKSEHSDEYLPSPQRQPRNLDHLPGQTNMQTQTRSPRRTEREHMATDAELLGHGGRPRSGSNRQQPWV